MELQEFRLPDVGEGLEEAEIVSWRVTVGDTIIVNQVIVEIETAKSLVELPSPYPGVVVELTVAEGQMVSVGTVIIRIGTETATGAAATRSTPDVPPAAAGVPERTQILVGAGPRTDSGPRRPRAAPRRYGSRPDAKPGESVTAPTGDASRPRAKPPVRKFARELGVDLAGIEGTGPAGSITRSDVHAATASPARVATAGPASGPLPGARETRIPIRGVRRTTAAAMVASAFTAPHVTVFTTIDVTESMRLLERLRSRREFAELRLSPMTLLARAMCIAYRQTPEINSGWDEPAGEIVLKHYVNLGIASATDRGLLVPHVPDADCMDLPNLSRGIADVVDAARDGRSEPAQLLGGTMSITNIGVFGVDTGTPILPPGQSAIVCLGAVSERPWVVDHQLVARQVTTLGLSFDHRLLDGAQGSRFLGDVAALLSDPSQALAWV